MSLVEVEFATMAARALSLQPWPPHLVACGQSGLIDVENAGGNENSMVATADGFACQVFLNTVMNLPSSK